jgi:hypothetical protein
MKRAFLKLIKHVCVMLSFRIRINVLESDRGGVEKQTSKVTSTQTDERLKKQLSYFLQRIQQK